MDTIEKAVQDLRKRGVIGGSMRVGENVLIFKGGPFLTVEVTHDTDCDGHGPFARGGSPTP